MRRRSRGIAKELLGMVLGDMKRNAEILAIFATTEARQS
jgi:hypothetical protein